MPYARSIVSLLMTGLRGRRAGKGYWSVVIGLTFAQPAVNGER